MGVMAVDRLDFANAPQMKYLQGWAYTQDQGNVFPLF
jgi:hypothetical protein